MSDEMELSDREIERILEGARLRTDPERDERILAAAGAAMPHPAAKPSRLWWAAAAAAILAVVLGIRGIRDLGPAEEPAPTVVARAPAEPPPHAAAHPVMVRSVFPMEIEEVLTVRGIDATTIPSIEERINAMGVRDVKVDGLGRYAYRSALRPGDLEKLTRYLGDLGVDIRGLGGEKGPIVRLDDVTSGLEANAGDAFENQAELRRVLVLAAAARRLEEQRRTTDLPRLPGTEDYRALPENRFTDPRDEPLSTCSIDVDTASYANVRRFLMKGQLPPPAAVRVEELVNYFSYDYPAPDGERPFSSSIEVATCPWNPKNRIVRIGLKGREIAREHIPARNLVFLLDVSGSMQAQDKLPLVKAAMKLLVGTLREEDHVSIVVYASDTRVVLEPTSGSDRPTIVAAIDGLSANGSTNGEGGIRLAYEMAHQTFEEGAINRILLATDGDFNVGETSREALLALIEKERQGGVYLTVLGVGTGNLKDSRVEMLADAGNGNYAYLDSILEAQKVLVREAGGTMVTIAKDVKVQVEFNPAKVGAYRLIGYENRALAAADFNNDAKDAGEIGAGHTVTVLYEITPPGDSGGSPEVDPLRYQKPAPPLEPAGEHGDEVLTLKLRYKLPEESESVLVETPVADPGRVPLTEASQDLVFASAVASFGMLLRRSESAENLSFDLVKELAQTSLGEDQHGDRAEFLKLVDIAGKLGR